MRPGRLSLQITILRINRSCRLYPAHCWPATPPWVRAAARPMRPCRAAGLRALADIHDPCTSFWHRRLRAWWLGEGRADADVAIPTRFKKPENDDRSSWSRSKRQRMRRSVLSQLLRDAERRIIEGLTANRFTFFSPALTIPVHAGRARSADAADHVVADPDRHAAVDFLSPRAARGEVRREILLDDLIARLSADCPWRDEPRETCGARFEDLPARRPPDLPSALRRFRVVRGGKA